MTPDYACEICHGSGMVDRYCNLCKERHFQAPPYIGCTSGEGRCPEPHGLVEGVYADLAKVIWKCSPDCNLSTLQRQPGCGWYRLGERIGEEEETATHTNYNTGEPCFCDEGEAAAIFGKEKE